MSAQADELLRTMKITVGCRFNAAKRLQSRDKKLTLLTAIATVCVITLTILPYLLKLPTEMADKLNALTVAFSITILASSLLQYSNGDAVLAEQHHRCALEINELRREFAVLAQNANDKDILDFTYDYNGVLQKYSVNHDDIDHLKYQVDRPEDHDWLKGWGRAYAIARIWIRSVIFEIAIGATIIGMLWLIFLYVLPASGLGQKVAAIFSEIRVGW